MPGREAIVARGALRVRGLGPRPSGKNGSELHRGVGEQGEGLLDPELRAVEREVREWKPVRGVAVDVVEHEPRDERDLPTPPGP